MQISGEHRSYWQRNLRITLVLLAIWFCATFVVAYFARPLAQVTFFGWPLSFYMAAQGSLIVYLLIILYYARRMARLDLEYNVHEGDDR